MPDDDARELGSMLRTFLERESPESRVREWMDRGSGFDPALWRRCAQELGIQGLGIAEPFGGSDAGPVVLGVAFEEMGRALLCGPFLSTVALATPALTYACETAVAGPLLRCIAAGESVAALAWGGDDPATSSLQASGGSVTGTAAIVVDGGDADLLLAAARSPDGAVGLYRVEVGAAGLSRTNLVSLDSTRRLARLDFDAVPSETLAIDVAPELSRAFDLARLLLAAEQLGGAQRALEMAVGHAKSRVQFGRRIGSFQAIKHRCADMLVDVELARSLVYHALASVRDDPETLPLESALAGSFVSDAYVRLAAANLQIHGGMGFTWEDAAHLYLKRAKSGQLILGDPVTRRRQLARYAGIDAAVA